MACLDHLDQNLMVQPHVAVIGGGCAGLAAGAELTANNVAVTLFEASPHLGGRARGVSWKGLSLDNGQHILLGAYNHTLRLLKLAGVDIKQAFDRMPLRLHMQGQLTLAAPAGLPAPFHILAALLLANGLSLPERLSAIRFMAWMKARDFILPQDETLGALLQRKRQPEKLVRLLWEPLCLAALNTPVDQASAQVFLNVLRDSFANSREDSDLLLPKCDLSSLLADPLDEYIRHHGGEVLTDSPVTRVGKNRQFEVETSDGARREFSHVILAVPPFRLAPLLSGFGEMQKTVGQVAHFEYQPIYTVYLQYPGTVRLETPMTGLVGTATRNSFSQWVFDRGQLCKQPGLLAVVISAEGGHQRLTQQALAQTVSDELAQSFPDLPAPLWYKVIAEKRATFACKSGLPRPQQKTSMAGLYLAGDYTTDGSVSNLYPATIEGAMRSGVQCAHDILAESKKVKQ